ncbi:TonB-dependent receptor plug domain-containing protein [Haloferula sp. A504]|uniref:TonB-dependent receptor plug domain-containing protein n=1 Tax=Haloferula sp. A504 TaxID=3373601 RepID=UPI0031C3C563|nr:TonB-dependent receptor [Verrucomicrobiaceae bacterium E54]
MHPKKSSGPRRTAKSCRPLLAALSLACPAQAEIESELDPLVVSALRTPVEPGLITSAVTSLDPRDLEKRGVLDLRDALNESPGVISTSTAGQTGAAGSLFIRGTTTADSQLIVDGIRLSDATTPLGNFLAGTRLDDLGRIEVLRGPQSAIHGGESVGGVLWLETANGRDRPGGRLRLEGGSFDSHDAHLSYGGSNEAFSWFAGIGKGGTRNDAIDQDFRRSRAALRFEWMPAEEVTLGVTFRATDSRFDFPGFFGPNVDELDAALGTIYLEARPTDAWLARMTMGYYRESYDNQGFFGNFGTDLDRTAIHTDHVIDFGPHHRLLAGASFEQTDFSNTIGTDVSADRFGAYLGWQWRPVDRFVTDAVLRWQDDQSYGDEFTWRVGAAWEFIEGTRVRGGIGRAFRAPTFLDLYGTAFGAGDPNLKAQTSLGWDLGIEHQLAEDHQLTLTWFENSIENRIRSLPTPPVNLPGDTPARGLETAIDGSWCDGRYGYRLAWTFLDESLQDQPEHTATASFDWRPLDRLLLGVGATYVDERSYGGAPLDDYLLLRIYGSYRIRDHLTVHGRVENLADSGYQLSNIGGTVVEGSGLGAFAGVTAEF